MINQKNILNGHNLSPPTAVEARRPPFRKCENSNEINGLDVHGERRRFTAAEVPPLSAKPITTGAVDSFFYYTADPLYLRYMLVPEVITPVLTKSGLGNFVDRGHER